MLELVEQLVATDCSCVNHLNEMPAMCFQSNNFMLYTLSLTAILAQNHNKYYVNKIFMVKWSHCRSDSCEVIMLTVKEAANKLQVTPERVRNMIYAGTIPAEKFGRIWTIPSFAVEERLAAKPRRGRPKKAEGKKHVNYQFISLNHTLFEECKNYIEERSSIERIMETETEEEREFFIMLWNFFLQQKQKVLIDQGVY
jgi:excisionase family DNA binding protein